MRLLLRVLFAAVLGVAVAIAGTLAATRVQATTPGLIPAITSLDRWVAAPGSPPVIDIPLRGSLGLVAVVGSTTASLASSNAATVRPIASVAKTMTALVVLEVHPLQPGDSGPVLTMTQVDVSDYRSIAASGGSYAPVTVGERLSERDLLLGLMLPSANNLALTAARWIDGTVRAFVGRLNARATAMGMLHTHFADPDGLDSATTSTAADLLILGENAIADQALLSVVSTATATLPDGTVVHNLDRLLGDEPGWLGIKTGWTPDASGCLLFAARRTAAPGAPSLTIVGAVLGQPAAASADPQHPELGGAFLAARAAVDAAFAGYAAIRLKAASIPVSGKVFAPWGTASSLRPAGADQVVLVRLGDALSIATTHSVLAVPLAAGASGGSVTVSLRGVVVGTWALVTSRQLEAPSPWWNLLHG